MSKKEKPLPFTIVRDTREKQSKGWYFDYYEKKDLCKCVERHLEDGDYATDAADIMIERKGSVSELFMNLGIGQENFWKKIEKLSQHKHAFLALEMTLSEIMRGSRYSELNPNFVLSCLLRIIVEYKVQVLFIGKSQKNNAFIFSLFKKIVNHERNNPDN